MSISSDVAAVLTEVGTAVTIYKPSGTIVTGEHIDFADHATHTNQAVQGSLQSLTFAASTAVSIGDVVSVNGWHTLLVTTKQPESFENTIITYNGAGYICNVIGKFQTYNQTAGYDSDYNKIVAWTDVYTDVRCPMTNKLYKTTMQTVGGESVDADVDVLTALVSNYYTSIVTGMRFVATGITRNFKVDYVEEFFMPSIMAVTLSEDKRP